jgi:large subunit ribosomal protein L10
MRLEEKKQVTEALAQELDGAGTIYLTDFTGLDVRSITELRSRFREQGVRYRVVKNTLMRRALEGLDLPDLSEHLEGPTGLVMSDEDPVAPAKVMKEFAKEHDDRPVVKIGVVDRRVVEADAVARLASLPPREHLLGAIAGGLTGSVGAIAGALEALLRDIAHMIESSARKREEG